ncbi:adenylyl-sulfate kinase [Fodinicurvata halophila]|uniref:Adenylyl-sulfate kinase n=2 Tax=Fodinicurvata halophila TaxID=1419723 RepID=A0ABV8UKS5_9PROT
MQDSSSSLDMLRETFKIVVVGHVDHGKSTLIGRLLYDTDSLPTGKFEELKAICDRRGMALEWSFVLDAFQAERDQAVTIDTTQIWFKTPKRDVVIIDAPGHREFLKNMVSGAASADAALLVVDAEEGVREQTRRHGYLLHLLGVKQVAVVINKMDLVDHSEDRYGEIVRDVTAYLHGIGVEPSFIVPISAREGDNIAKKSTSTPWYKGPTILEALDRFHSVTVPSEQALRMPVQDVYHFDQRRILVGRIEAGVLRPGDEILFSPSNKTARVKSLDIWDAPPLMEAHAGQSIGLTLEEQLFVERGEMISHVEDPPVLSTVFRARLFWLGHKPLEVGKRYTLKLATKTANVTVVGIDTLIDTDSLAHRPGTKLERNMIGEVVLRAREVLAFDEHVSLDKTGRFVLLEDYDLVGGGLISMEGYPDQRQSLTVRSTNVYSVEHTITRENRVVRNGHKGGVLWFTGLSGAGKSTLAMEVEKHLFQKGHQVYVLDGDNVRAGLNANLGFSPEERTENIRRVGEVAALFADAGFICITAFISPYQADRDRARGAANRIDSDAFHEIHVSADLNTCERRDPKGLYKKARAGEILDFTGVSAPYEAPATPELVVDTDAKDLASCVEQVVDYIDRTFRVE